MENPIEKQPVSPLGELLSRDVPEEVVDSLLQALNDKAESDQIRQDHWDKLADEYPEVRHFISVRSFQRYPDPADAEKRGEFTKAMLEVYALLTEARTTEALQALYAAPSATDENRPQAAEPESRLKQLFRQGKTTEHASKTGIARNVAVLGLFSLLTGRHKQRGTSAD